MKTIILTETQTRKIINKIINEQNVVRSESLTVDLGAVWAPGKWKITPQQISNIQNKVKQITDFINKNKNSNITIQIESGESSVTNYDREVSGNIKLEPGVLSQKRGEEMVSHLKSIFQKYLDSGMITKLPEFPKPIIKIGTTPYTGPNDLKDPSKVRKYNQEQFVRAIISLKKDYECIVGMEITIGYFPGKNKSKHTCDEAIFNLKMNGVSLGEVNLNNGDVDVTVNNYRKEYSEKLNNFNKQSEQHNKKFDQLISKGIENEGNRKKYLERFGLVEPKIEIPNRIVKISKEKGYRNVMDYVNTISKINQSFINLGRKSDNKIGGIRNQTFIINDEQAKKITNNSGTTDKIILSISPLVSENGKYKVFFQNGSHSDTPWVIIKNKDSEVPLFNSEPNVGMERGSVKETILLQTDLCGKPIQTKK